MVRSFYFHPTTQRAANRPYAPPDVTYCAFLINVRYALFTLIAKRL